MFKRKRTILPIIKSLKITTKIAIPTYLISKSIKNKITFLAASFLSTAKHKDGEKP